jgi:hypothetical protein
MEHDGSTKKAAKKGRKAFERDEPLYNSYSLSLCGLCLELFIVHLTLIIFIAFSCHHLHPNPLPLPLPEKEQEVVFGSS